MALLFEPIELLERLAALTPRPLINLVRSPGRPSASHAAQVVVRDLLRASPGSCTAPRWYWGRRGAPPTAACFGCLMSKQTRSERELISTVAGMVNRRRSHVRVRERVQGLRERGRCRLLGPRRTLVTEGRRAGRRAGRWLRRTKGECPFVPPTFPGDSGHRRKRAPYVACRDPREHDQPRRHDPAHGHRIGDREAEWPGDLHRL
jgi:hypothetical protein